jgi:hypothetical protein
MRTTQTDRPVAVVGFAPSAAAPVLRWLLAAPVEELDPYDLAMGRGGEEAYRAVVVENFYPQTGGLSPCAAARWAMPASPLTVVSLDDPAGRSLARQPDRPVFAYSDGRVQADLVAKNVNLRWGRLEFEALADGDIARVRLDPGEDSLYGVLAALACALGLGMPLTEAVARLNTSV